jgi:hypothetical protein
MAWHFKKSRQKFVSLKFINNFFAQNISASKISPIGKQLK